MSIKDVNGRVLIDQYVRNKWREYFNNLLNAEGQDRVDVAMMDFEEVNRVVYQGREAISMKGFKNAV